MKHKIYCGRLLVAPTANLYIKKEKKYEQRDKNSDSSEFW